jgi:hypothetical protein
MTKNITTRERIGVKRAFHAELPELTKRWPQKIQTNRSDIFRLENLSVWQILVFRYGLLMRNRGYIEFETLGENSTVHIEEY